jgi:carbamoyl-phosphate synthase large subunit
MGADALLGPEMRSTGEVMGHAARFGHAFAKAQMAAGDRLPLEGTVFMSLNDYDKSAGLRLARDLVRLGFQIAASRGTAEFFRRAGVPVTAINKLSEGSPHILDAIKAGQVQLIINTPYGSTSHGDGKYIRTTAVRYGVPLLTTLSAASAAINGIKILREKALNVRSLQYHYSVQ